MEGVVRRRDASVIGEVVEDALANGMILYIAAAMGAIALAGSVVGNRLSSKVSERWFLALVESLLVLSGIALIVRG